MNLIKKVICGSVSLSVMTLTGCSIKFTEGVNIPKEYDNAVNQSLSNEFHSSKASNIWNQTGFELSYIKVLNLNVSNSNSDLSWLNYCESLENLLVIFNTDNFDEFSSVEKLSNLKKISINSVKRGLIGFDNFGFLLHSNNLEEIELNGVQIDVNFLERLNTLKRIKFDSNNFFNSYINFKKFPFLERIDFGDMETYDIATFLSKDSFDYLLEKGVVLVSKDFNLVENLTEIYWNLHRDVLFLNLNDNSSDLEKIDAILEHILLRFNYNPEFSKKNNSLIENLLREELYKEGFLYGALNYSDFSGVICGNYAAYFKALANNVDLETYIMLSKTHAWNLIKINDNYYYLDPTWLDSKENLEKIKNGEGWSLEWYLNDPTIKYDINHTAYNIPYGIDLEGIELKGNKVYVFLTPGRIILLGSLVSLSLLPILKDKIHNKKEKTKVKKNK